ncbi:cyclic-nucleotide-gated cation channel [Clonorchis sinensis]|uniref:Cyclic-nucleotide-gated cation channel n=1 Tax=Clonorchis sinensis TaxID=79923 RepID=G7YPA1_CLOSI|nr:cyclic-nucleotide-gated cation channel [Clonorchis sinensis]
MDSGIARPLARIRISQSNLNRSMSSASVPPIQLKLDRSDSTLSASVIGRLRELRHKFATRTEEVRRHTAAKADVHSSAEEEEAEEDEATGEVTTDLSRTEHDLVLNENLGDQMKKGETEHWWSARPGRKLVIRQPFCTACLAPHRKHFIVFQDKPLIRIDQPIDESATGKPADEQTDLDARALIFLNNVSL